MRAGTRLFRIHSAGLGAWWFANDGSGRFDLTGDPERGACYLAETPVGAFVEVFRVALVSQTAVRARALSTLALPLRAVLADCTSGRARAFGVTGAIHSGEDYDRTQAWAQALSGAGFDGIRSPLSRDPRQTLAGVALFGPAGSPRWRAGRAEPIPLDVIREAQRRFGIRVLPAP